jgi:hypothetical protein
MAGVLICAALAAAALTVVGAHALDVAAAPVDSAPVDSAPVCFCVAPCVKVEGCVRPNIGLQYSLPGNKSSGYFCNTFNTGATAQPPDWPLALQNKDLSVNVDFRSAPNCDGTGTVAVRLGPKPACPSAASGTDACAQCSVIATAIGDIGPGRGQCKYGSSSYSCTSCISEGGETKYTTGAPSNTGAPSSFSPRTSAAQSIAPPLLAAVLALAAATLRYE